MEERHATASGPRPGNHATVTVSSASATVQVNGQVRLTAAEHHAAGDVAPSIPGISPRTAARIAPGWIRRAIDPARPVRLRRSSQQQARLDRRERTLLPPQPLPFTLLLLTSSRCQLIAGATSVIPVSGSTT